MAFLWSYFKSLFVEFVSLIGLVICCAIIAVVFGSLFTFVAVIGTTL